MESAMADMRKVQLLRLTKSKMQTEQQVSNTNIAPVIVYKGPQVGDDVVTQQEDQKKKDRDDDDDEELDALSTTDELVIDTRYERRQEDALVGNALRRYVKRNAIWTPQSRFGQR
jgi:hypothetical protein